MQMLMVRYWASHGSPAELDTFPAGRVKIEPRGHDTVTISGKDEMLDRYTIEGLIWGRETLWFDSKPESRCRRHDRCGIRPLRSDS